MYRLMVAGPVASSLPGDQSIDFKIKLASRWRFFVHIGILVFLVSGLYLFMKAIPYHRGDSTYHMMIGIKILLAIIVFFFISVLVGRSEKLGFIRKKATGTLIWVTVLAVTIVGIASYLKTRGPKTWPADQPQLPSTLKKEKAKQVKPDKEKEPTDPGSTPSKTEKTTN